jgi:hypothetical protein
MLARPVDIALSAGRGTGILAAQQDEARSADQDFAAAQQRLPSERVNRK